MTSLRRHVAGAVGLACCLLALARPSAAAPGLTLLHTHGSDIVDAHGHKVRLRGVNIGGWLLIEPWMCPAGPGMADNMAIIKTLDKRFGVAKEQELLHTYERSWITTHDLDIIQSQGLNFIRVPVAWPNFETLDGKWRPDAFEMTDWIVSEAAKRGIYTLIDMHNVVGGEMAGASSGQEDNAYWTSAKDREETDALWARIAAHYKDNPAVMGYDLINEPFGAPSPLDVHKAYARLYKVVRGVDPSHIIVMDSTYGSFGLDTMPDPAAHGWTNLIYEIHEYQFGKPGDVVEKSAQGRVDSINAHRAWNLPAYIGEFNNFGGDPASGFQTWRDVLSLYNDNDINWTCWAYKAIHGDVTDSWGLVDPKTPRPPVPDLNKDDAATIAADWKQWTTTNAFVLNTMIAPVIRGGESPYSGTAQSIPGTIDFDTYDLGGPGLGYEMNGSVANQGKVGRNDGVGIETCTDTSGSGGDGRDVGWAMDGDWLRYTVDVAKAGTYDVVIRASSGANGGILHLENGDGVDLSGPIQVPSTGAWQTWANVKAKVNLPAGKQIIELYEDTGGYNLEYMTFTAQ